MRRSMALGLLAFVLCWASGAGLVARGRRPPRTWRLDMSAETAGKVSVPAFPGPSFRGTSLEKLKLQIAQLAASMDRGQTRYKYVDAYQNKADTMKELLRQLVEHPSAPSVGNDLSKLDGEWELLYTNVSHGIFRSSPFFLAIEEAYDNQMLSNLFFRLHELQTCSWGASTVGRVAQIWDSKERKMYSEFDTSLFGLTVIPIVGFWKLLPTFGGCVRTESNITSSGIEEDGRIEMVVDLTRAKEVPGLPPLPLLGNNVYKIKVPVGDIWPKLPWNKDLARCAVRIRYLDDDFRVAADKYGEFFVYTRPVCARE